MAAPRAQNGGGQSGYTLTELLLVVTIAGSVSAAALPRLADIADEADRNALAYARGALLSSLRTVHALAARRDDAHIEIAGEAVTLRQGYPLAEAAELAKLIELQGFSVQRQGDALAVVSPASRYCFRYNGAAAGLPVVGPVAAMGPSGC